jgi:hypothetical protein
MKRTFIMLSALFVATAASVQPVLGCAVCGGERDSQMVQGAESGVLTLVLITYALLMGGGGMIAFWSIRSRRISASGKP